MALANKFLKAEQIISMGLGMLRRELILPRLVQRLGRADFQGAKDDTINIRIPARTEAREYEFRTRSNPIVMDDLEEFSVPIALEHHPYKAVPVTDEELTLDITSFGEQVLQPQALAVAEKLETYVAAAMADGNYADGHELDFNYDTDDPYKLLVRARKLLNTQFVPVTGRVAVLGANVEEAFLSHDLFVKANESGSTDTLRESIIGRVAGFTVVGNVNSIPPDDAYIFHPTAYAFANVSPVVPDGVVAGAGTVFDGLAMRWIRDYDPNFLRDRSVLSAFAGATSVEDGRDLDAGSSAFGELTGENVRAVKVAGAGS